MAAARIGDHEPLCTANRHRLLLALCGLGGFGELAEDLLRGDGRQAVAASDIFQQVVQGAVVMAGKVILQTICGQLLQAAVEGL